MKSKNEIDALIVELKHKEKSKQKPKSKQNLWLLTQSDDSFFDEVPGINVFIGQFLECKDSRRSFLHNSGMAPKIVKTMFHENFDMINLPGFLEVVMTIVRENYLKSHSFELLYLTTLLKVIEENMGNPSFETETTLSFLIELAGIIKSKSTFFYFNMKLFRAIGRVLSKNHLLYLESEDFISQLMLFVFDCYLENAIKLKEMLISTSKTQIDKNLVSESQFRLVCFYLSKPFYMRLMSRFEHFQGKLRAMSELFVVIAKLQGKFTPHIIDFYIDYYQTCLVLFNSHLKSCLPVLSIEFILLRHDEIVAQLKKINQKDKLLGFKEFCGQYIQSMQMEIKPPVRPPAREALIRVTPFAAKKSFAESSKRIFTPKKRSFILPHRS